MRTYLTVTLAAATILAVSSTAAVAQTEAQARKSYDAAIANAKRLFEKCDADALAAGVTEDYTGITSNGNVTKGRAGELKGDREFCAANTVLSWDATTTDFHSSGPIAWAAGVMTMTFKSKATGKVGKEEIHYLATYRHGPDDKWYQQYFIEAPVKEAKK